MKIKKYSVNPEVQAGIETALKIRDSHLMRDVVKEKVNATRKSNKPKTLKISKKK